MNQQSASADIVVATNPVQTESDFCEPNTVTEASQAAASSKMDVDTNAEKVPAAADQTQALKTVVNTPTPTQMPVAESK